MFKVALVAVCILIARCTSALDNYEEELRWDRLNEDYSSVRIQLTTTTAPADAENAREESYDLFPRSLGKIIRQFGVDEMHLSFTQGRWLYDQYGLPPVPAPPPGAQMWLWFSNNNNNDNDDLRIDDVDQRFGGAMEALSGLLCASLHEATTLRCMASSPAFLPNHNRSNGTVVVDWQLLRHASMPREAVCTENLTPWLKLSPCRGRAGLAALLDPRFVFATSYHSIGVDFYPASDGNVELALSLGYVVRHERLDGGVAMLARMLGRSDGALPLPERCALASRTDVLVAATASTEQLSLPPLDEWQQRQQRVARYAFDALANVAMRHRQQQPTKSEQHRPLSVHRRSAGYGDARGAYVLTLMLRDGDARESARIAYFEAIPWQMRVYSHRIGGLDGVDEWLFVPPEDRLAFGRFEFTATLRRGEPLSLHIEYDKAFMVWTEYPPDAHQGFLSPSGIVTVLSADDAAAYRHYTEPLLVTLPTPDFSMPYNVITLTGTVLAIFFGAIFNSLLRRRRHLRDGSVELSQRPIAKMFRFVKSLLPNSRAR
jgi:GPI-anchor transamidase subunit T